MIGEAVECDIFNYVKITNLILIINVMLCHNASERFMNGSEMGLKSNKFKLIINWNDNYYYIKKLSQSDWNYQ